MDIVNVQIRNFMPIGEANLMLQDKGLVLLQGINVDDSSAQSNGAGKSSIADSISWCLYGITARGESGDNVVNSKRGKNCYVRIAIEDGDDIYQIVRYRKHSKGKSRLQVTRLVDLSQWSKEPWEVEGDDLTKGTDKLTQELVTKIIGCSAEVFNSVVYMGQEAMTDLPGMTDKNLKELVEEAAGITVLVEALMEARRRHKIAETAVADAHREATRINDRTLLLESQLEDSQLRCDSWQEESDARLSKAQKDLAEAEEFLAQFQKKEKDTEKKLEKVPAAIERLNVKIASIKDEKVKLAALDSEVNAHSKTVALANARHEDAHRRKIKADRAVENIRDRIGTECSECGKEYCEKDMAVAKEAALAAVAVAIKEVLAAKKDLEYEQLNATRATEEYELYVMSMTDVSEALAKRDELQNAMGVLAKITQRVKELTTAKNTAQAAVEAAKSAGNPFVSQVESISAKIAEHTELGEAAMKVYGERVEAMTIAADAVSVFSPSGVRAHVLDTVTPFLNSRTSHYLSMLSDDNLSAEWNTVKINASGEASENFHIGAKNKLMETETFKMLSGGQKRKVRLACGMALQDVVAQRAEKPISLLMADEIDDAMDEAGLERLMTLLEEKARERGTLLIISHNELSDWVREQSTVILEGGVSRVEGVLAA